MKTSVIQNIIAVMAYDAMDPGNGDIYRKWFRKLGFYEKGQLWNVGRKMGRWIDTIYFQWSRPEPEDDE
ncbi:hypothetical protein N7535_007833 [Penicillium sp. DV-2018c]|nr:hypothetical protein N7461_003869 [Penicillium sp. DV-2018c]KAJ5566195.1 hypothetical protein N7535_007833 [Penicillium sp. DV-2018c]